MNSIEHALEKARDVEMSNIHNEEATTQEMFIIGGEQIYDACLPFSDRLYLTLIHEDPKNLRPADAFFPKYADTFRCVSDEAHTTPEGLPYRYVTFER